MKGSPKGGGTRTDARVRSQNETPPMTFPRPAIPSLCALAASLAVSTAGAQDLQPFDVDGPDGPAFAATPLDAFDYPWAMDFLPDGRALVSERTGGMWLVGADGKKIGAIADVPSVTPRNQGGLGDVVVHPNFAENRTVFVSYVERDANDDALSGAVVIRARLDLADDGGRLVRPTTIWRQSPKMRGNGHYGHRIVVAPDGHLFITSGERQHFTPAQNMAMNLGKMIRLNEDGSIPDDNPFYPAGGIAREVWSLGHRNPLGLAFDADGDLWEIEMGPAGGDEMNQIFRGENYGYPTVSEGEHYSGVEIPSHAEIPTFEAPKEFWVPAISPASLAIYGGDLFADWKGDAFIGGLSSLALVRVEFGVDDKKKTAKEAARYSWGARVREVEEGPDGALYVLEDGPGGRLIRLAPRSGN